MYLNLKKKIIYKTILIEELFYKILYYLSRMFINMKIIKEI